MKTALKMALSVAIWLGFAARAEAQTGWVVRSGIIEAQMPAELAKWTAPPYNLQPICVNGYEISGVARFSALYVEPGDNLEVLASFALTEAALSLTNSSRQSSGYRLIWLNGFGYGTGARFNAIWKKTNGAAQQIRVGQTLAQHQADVADLEAQDYKLAGVSSYNEDGSPVHAGWWNYSPIASIVTDVVYSQTATQYQAAFDAHPASGGWRLTSVSGYTVGSTERFTAMFKKLSGPAWSSIVGLNSTNFDSANNNAHYTGNRPAFLHAYAFSNTPHWNAVWQHDHGLAANWTEAIANEVRDYMATNSSPGLSLAITRNGRLIYASGFGLANTSTGEMVGPLHRFRMASVSKPFTAVAVLRALEQYPGTLESFVFGSGALLGTTYGHNNYTAPQKAIRVRHLLTMTSSWVSDGKLWYEAEPSWGSDNGPAIDWQLDAYDQTSYMSPGDYAKYENINFVTAARIVEVLSGQTYENYVKNQILAPCGVTDMAVGNRRKADRQTREVTYYPDVEDEGPYLIDPRRMDGSTAWIAKPMDMLLFARRMDDDSTFTDLLSASSMSAMRTPSHAPEYPFGNGAGMNPDTYGLGWYSHGSPVSAWSHNGSMDGSAAYLSTGTNGVSWAYVTNRRSALDESSSDFFTQMTSRITILGIAGAWPSDNYNLFSQFSAGYDSWRDENFTSLDRSQPGLQWSVWGFAADPDGDGLPNAIEAYLGRDPNVAETSHPFSLSKSGNTMTLRWLRANVDRHVVPTVQSSTDLTTWVDAFGISIDRRDDLIAPTGYHYEEIAVGITTGHRFYRLRFEPE